VAEICPKGDSTESKRNFKTLSKESQCLCGHRDTFTTLTLLAAHGVVLVSVTLGGPRLLNFQRLESLTPSYCLLHEVQPAGNRKSHSN
jgi:hypothetical protein